MQESRILQKLRKSMSISDWDAKEIEDKAEAIYARFSKRSTEEGTEDDAEA